MNKHGFEAPVSVKTIGNIPRVVNGREKDLMRLPGGPERIVEALNATRNFWSPETAVEETLAQLKKVEQLRKDAWAEVQRLRAKYEPGDVA